ncbi:MAG: DMT family transporter [Paracoccaceae bacterium]
MAISTTNPTSQPVLAAGLMALGMLTIGFTDNLVPIFADTVGLWQFHITRTLMALPLMWIGARAFGLRFWPRRFGRVALRSLFQAGAMMIYFGCLAFMPVAEVGAGLFSAPIFVLLITRFAFGIRFGWIRAAAVLVGFAGVMLVLQPGVGGLRPVTLFPLAAAVLYAIGNIATREWCDGETAATLTAGFFVMLLVFGLIGLAVIGLSGVVAPDGADGFVLRGLVRADAAFYSVTAIQALGSLVAVSFMLRAYQLAEASQVAVFEYSLLIFAAFWGWLIWGQVLNGAAFAGIALIIGAGAVIALRS